VQAQGPMPMHRPTRIVVSFLLHGVAAGLLCAAVFLFLLGGLLINAMTGVSRAVAEFEGLALSAACGALAYFARKAALQISANAKALGEPQKIQPPPTTSSPS
jgi:hypothetical protein